LVFSGTPEEMIHNMDNYTASFLSKKLKTNKNHPNILI
jgi:hypothetical protein